MKREHTPTPVFLSCPSSFDTAGGRCDLSHTHGGRRRKQPSRHKQNTPSNTQNSPQNRTAGQGQGIHTPNNFQVVREANKTRTGLSEDRRRDGTHQPHRILRPPTLAATTHHPSPTTRPNRVPLVWSHHHLGHTPATNQPRSRPHHTRQQGRTQHPRQRANHLQNMQQKQRQSQRTKHQTPTTNHKKPCFMVKNQPTPTGDTPCTPVQDLVRLSEIPPFYGLVYLSTFLLVCWW